MDTIIFYILAATALAGTLLCITRATRCTR